MYSNKDILLIHTDHSYFPKFKTQTPKIIILTEHYAMTHAKIVRSKIDTQQLLVCWLLEPESIHPECYAKLDNAAPQFDIILTHHRWVVCKYPNARYVPWGTTWIKETDRDIHTKFWSYPTCVFSGKQMTPLHKFRQEIINWLHSKNIITYGRNHNPLPDKITLLKTSPFHIVVENGYIHGYFTEKIMDCFLTGTVPIYYGCPDIHKQFDIRGIICFKTLGDLENIFSKLSMELYHQMLDAVKYNYEQALKYINQEDLIVDAINQNIRN